MATFDVLPRTFTPYAAEHPYFDAQWFDFLPLCQEFDDCFELLLTAKLFFSQIKMNREQLAEILEQRRRTSLTLEHLAYRNGFCEVEEALKMMKAHGEIKRIIEKDLAGS